MRKFYLFAITLTLAARLNFTGYTCYAAEPVHTVHIELYGETQDDGKNQTCGTRITSPLAELRYTARDEKNNFGILLGTRNLVKQAPVEIKYGNLSYSGSLSKLNSPELSNGTSPFTTSILTPLCVTASLPGYSSFTKPESYFFQAKLNHITKTPLSFTINMSLLPENSYPVFSTLISNKFFSNQLTLSASCTAGKFIFEGADSSSWLLSSPWYAGGEMFCSLFQVSTGYKRKSTGSGVQASFMTAFYETPFGPFTNVYRADLKLTIKQADFFASAFLNSFEDTLTSSEKSMDPEAQFKAGLVTKTPFLTKNANLWYIKFGLNAYTKINLTGTTHPLRINTGLQLSADLTTLAFSVSADGRMSSQKPEDFPQAIEQNGLSFQLNNSWYFKSFNPALALTLSKDSYKISLNVANNSKQKISGTCTLNISTKDEKIEKKLTTSISCRYNLKTITLVGKLSATLE